MFGYLLRYIEIDVVGDRKARVGQQQHFRMRANIIPPLHLVIWPMAMLMMCTYLRLEIAKSGNSIKFKTDLCVVLGMCTRLNGSRQDPIGNFNKLKNIIVRHLKCSYQNCKSRTDNSIKFKVGL